jgi:hypothetical protein
MLSVSQHGASCTVMTAVLEKAGRMISWGSGRSEDGSLIITLLVLPRDLGWTSTLQIATTPGLPLGTRRQGVLAA